MKSLRDQWTEVSVISSTLVAIAIIHTQTLRLVGVELFSVPGLAVAAALPIVPFTVLARDKTQITCEGQRMESRG